MKLPQLLTIDQAADRITSAGIPYSAATLRLWRRTWPDGDRKGPPPLLVTPRRLRYRAEDIDEFIRAAAGAAAREPGAVSG